MTYRLHVQVEAAGMEAHGMVRADTIGKALALARQMAATLRAECNSKGDKLPKPESGLNSRKPLRCPHGVWLDRRCDACNRDQVR